jgi:hypothetical protein
MLVSNWLLDAFLFGALLVAIVVDAFVPATHGVATLLVVGAITYFAAEDICHWLRGRSLWSQESLASSVAASVAGFAYYWWRNDSDLIATGLHIGLMMASLMLLIGVVAAVSSAWTERSPLPLVGLIATLVLTPILGALAGLLIYVLTSASIALVLKLAIALIGAALWRVWQTVRPPAVNEASPQSAAPVTPPAGTGGPGMRTIVPHQGTVFARFVAPLVLGGVVFLVVQKVLGTVVQ